MYLPADENEDTCLLRSNVLFVYTGYMQVWNAEVGKGLRFCSTKGKKRKKTFERVIVHLYIQLMLSGFFVLLPLPF
jgi:hypothetical protein